MEFRRIHQWVCWEVMLVDNVQSQSEFLNVFAVFPQNVSTKKQNNKF